MVGGGRGVCGGWKARTRVYNEGTTCSLEIQKKAVLYQNKYGIYAHMCMCASGAVMTCFRHDWHEALRLLKLCLFLALLVNFLIVHVICDAPVLATFVLHLCI